MSLHTFLLCTGGQFRYLSTDGKTISKVEKKLDIPKEIKAPVQKGERAGKMVYYADGKKLGSVPVIYGESVKKAGYGDCIGMIWEEYML